MDKIKEAKRVFDIEIKALEKTRNAIDATFVEILDALVTCKGKVIITGMGKSGHIASKIAATLSSLGTPSFSLHPAEAQHGDLGMISKEDVVLAISYSGESNEITAILPNIKLIGAKLICITGNSESTLAEASDIVQILPNFDEACYLGLAPTSSTTSALCYGDALAVVASAVYGFKDKDFGKFHPAGSLGKKLILKVDDLMSSGNDNATVLINSNLQDAIVEISKKGLGMVAVIDYKGVLKGVITDGDLRRQLEKSVNIYTMKVDDIMSVSPVTIKSGALAIDALNLMHEHNVSALPVVMEGKIVGIIRLQAIVKIGIVG